MYVYVCLYVYVYVFEAREYSTRIKNNLKVESAEYYQ